MDETIHITVTEHSCVVHKTKIQKYCHDKKVEYSLYLSKKVFDLSDDGYFYWRISIDGYAITDSIAEIVDDNNLKR